jgi:hypothetical protein
MFERGIWRIPPLRTEHPYFALLKVVAIKK